MNIERHNRIKKQAQQTKYYKEVVSWYEEADSELKAKFKLVLPDVRGPYLRDRYKDKEDTAGEKCK